MKDEVKKMTLKPNIHEFLDYRQFLRAMYEFKKSQSAGFSLRTFSRLAGLRSSNFLKLIMDGDRNLSLEGIHKFARAFKLSKPESNFFEALVLFGQAKSAEEKNRYYERIIQSKSYNEVKKLEANQYVYFSNWHYVALRELVKLKGFREDPQWINRKLDTRFSHEEIQKAFNLLIALNLLHRDEGNHLRQTEEKLTTSPEISSLAVLNFHREMIRKASDSLEKSKTDHRDVSTLTIGLSKSQYDQIRERINQFRREIHAIATESRDPEAVYQINFQLFNLSEVPWN